MLHDSIQETFDMSGEKEISKLRKEIDQIDKDLLQLVNQRAKCAVQIGLIKKKEGMPVFVPEREKQVIEQLVGMNEGPLADDTIEELYQWLFIQMKNLE